MSETLKPKNRYLVKWLRNGTVNRGEFEANDDTAAWVHVDKNYPMHIFVSLQKIIDVTRPKKKE